VGATDPSRDPRGQPGVVLYMDGFGLRPALDSGSLLGTEAAVQAELVALSH